MSAEFKFPNHDAATPCLDDDPQPTNFPVVQGWQSESIHEIYPPGGNSMLFRTFESARVRTFHACEKCRSRKAKCSGERPTCKRCKERLLFCEYSREPRTRGSAKPRPMPFPSQRAARPRASSVASQPQISPLKDKVPTMPSETEEIHHRRQSLPTNVHNISAQQPFQHYCSPLSQELNINSVLPTFQETGNREEYPRSQAMMWPESAPGNWGVRRFSVQHPMQSAPFLSNTPQKTHQLSLSYPNMSPSSSFNNYSMIQPSNDFGTPDAPQEIPSTAPLSVPSLDHSYRPWVDTSNGDYEFDPDTPSFTPPGGWGESEPSSATSSTFSSDIFVGHQPTDWSTFPGHDDQEQHNQPLPKSPGQKESDIHLLQPAPISLTNGNAFWLQEGGIDYMETT